MLSINQISLLKGTDGIITLKSSLIKSYEQVQIEIFNTCVKNPISVLSFGTKPTLIHDNVYTVSFKTNSLNYGIYEIKLIRFHTPKEKTLPEHKDFHGGYDFDRFFFEITNSTKEELTNNELSRIVTKKEAEFDDDFVSGINISKNKNSNEYGIFILVKGLKTGIRYRLKKVEILPLKKGLDSSDIVIITNYFLEHYTSINYKFDYSLEEAKKSQNQNPISVVYFPKIISENIKDVINYSYEKTMFLLQAFSLTRGASGVIINIVIFDLKKNKIYYSTPNEPYVGNLATGDLSGENVDFLNAIIDTLENNPFKSLLASLYKEALIEKDESFKILRLWNILEVLTENKNYNPNETLVDYNGNVISIENDKHEKIPQKLDNLVNKVYNLIKEHRIGNTNETFENVKMWLALRNAAAHFGSIYNYEKLRSKRDKIYAEKAIKIIKNSKGYNPILSRLKEDVKYILINDSL